MSGLHLLHVPNYEKLIAASFPCQAEVAQFWRGLLLSTYSPPTSEMLFPLLTRWEVQIHLHEETADPFAWYATALLLLWSWVVDSKRY